ncbi:MAG: DHH family phosphoesterase [Bacilli bacterium]|nr:DHH family phosphoesterase [bacterium]MDY5992878.1 DHH family phosphoesterase [Bacilli bacterium]MEE0014718.1 DHH family phosphoesterase [Bacilli bacterium]
MRIIDKKRELNKAIRGSKNVFLMAHKDLDLDALGSCIGLSTILGQKKKNCYIIIDDKNHELGVEKVLRELEGCIKIIKSEEVDRYLYPKLSKNLLIILDTNKTDLVQSKDILKKIEKKVIIDHHDTSKTTIKGALTIIDNEVSSTCEMIAELVEHYDVELEPYYATVLLSGIVLDTNNFTLKTTAETYYAAYYLSSLGASAKKVQYLLKQDIMDYTERQKLLADIQTINNRIAFTKATPYTIYRREDLAKVADTLLFFNNIEASFVIGKIGKDTVGISARSLGNYNISKILEKLGGGGDTYNGAARFEKTTISKVEQMLKKEIQDQEGE